MKKFSLVCGLLGVATLLLAGCQSTVSLEEAKKVTASFEGKGIVEQHRMVYATLGDRMGGEIHALSLKTMTPEQASRAGLAS